jgi:hypothetical protein
MKRKPIQSNPGDLNLEVERFPEEDLKALLRHLKVRRRTLPNGTIEVEINTGFERFVLTLTPVKGGLNG